MPVTVQITLECDTCGKTAESQDDHEDCIVFASDIGWKWQYPDVITCDECQAKNRDSSQSESKG